MSALHVTPGDRQELIASLRRLPAPWFFADVRDRTGGADVIEIGGLNTDCELTEWASSVVASGHAVSAVPAEEAVVLDPRFFAGGQPPPAYLEMLRECSRRAVALLEAPVRPENVAAEVWALHRAVAGPDARRSALSHAAGLLRVAGGWPAAVRLPAPSAIGAAAAGHPSGDPAAFAYATAGSALSLDAGAAEAVRLVSRLAHLQTVRLIGPGLGPAALRWEAGVLLALVDRDDAEGGD